MGESSNGRRSARASRTGWAVLAAVVLVLVIIVGALAASVYMVPPRSERGPLIPATSPPFVSP